MKETKFHIKSTVEDMDSTVNAIIEFCKSNNISRIDISDITMIIGEALSNCVKHAYPSGVGAVDVLCKLENKILEISVKDYGKGIKDIEKSKETSFTTNPDKGAGLGFSIMKSFSGNEVEVESSKSGTTITMKKSVSFEKEINPELNQPATS